MIDQLKNKGDNPPTFDLRSLNCTSMMVGILNSIGCGIPQNEILIANGMGLAPASTGEDLRNMPLQPWMSRSLVYGTAPVDLNCN